MLAQGKTIRRIKSLEELQQEALELEALRKRAAEKETLGRIASLENKLLQLDGQLIQAKANVQSWTNANSELSRGAAKARASNQGFGRGIFGALAGTKVRAAMRSAAASSNADLAKQIANKRAKIAENKQNAQEAVRRTQQAILETKQELKSLSSAKKSPEKPQASVAKSASASLDLLRKLKEAHENGLLTDEEFQTKRLKPVSSL